MKRKNILTRSDTDFHRMLKINSARKGMTKIDYERYLVKKCKKRKEILEDVFQEMFW